MRRRAAVAAVLSHTIKDLGVVERRMWKFDPGSPHPANTLWLSRALFTLTLHLFFVLLLLFGFATFPFIT